MLYMTDYSAKGVLRGVIRDATRGVPPYEKLREAAVARYVKILAKKNNPRGYMEKMFDFFSQYCISYGMKTTKTKGYLGVFVPYFAEADGDWNLHCRFFCARYFYPDVNLIGDSVENLPIVFYGHALERFFQRSMKLSWTDVKREVAPALGYFALWSFDFKKKPLNIVLPSESGGYWVGTLDGKCRVIVKTYVHRSDRLEKIAVELRALMNAWNSTDRVEDIQLLMEGILERHPWVFEPREEEE